MARILQLTDFHIFSDPAAQLKGIRPHETLRKVIDHIVASKPAFDHVIVTGDHTHDELAESYRLGQEQLERLTKPVSRVPGNHDDRPVMRSVFSNLPGSGQDAIEFAFPCRDESNWACLGLDSHLPGEVSGRITATQMDGLKTTLQELACDNIALFMHHPPVDIGSVWMDQIGLAQRELLADVVKADQRIQLIVCGHVHHDFQSQLHQATVLASPSTSIQFDPNGDQPTFSEDAPGYRILELTKDGWSTEVVRVPEAAGTLDLSEG